MIEVINPYSAKILLAARDGDSIREISRKTKISYGWTYQWVEQLRELGVLTREGNRVRINKDSNIYKKFFSLIKIVLGQHLSLKTAYDLPNFIGLPYCFTSTDAIFIWTKGGYNIGRSAENYPIFINVLKKDLSKWRKFFSNLSIKHTTDKPMAGIYFFLFPVSEIKSESIDKTPVLPLKDAVAFAKKHVYNFQPALEMLDEMYGLGLKIKYRENSDV